MAYIPKNLNNMGVHTPIDHNRKNTYNALAEGIRLLREMKIQEYNNWRMENLTITPDISGENFSGNDLSGAYLNEVPCIRTNFSSCNLTKANLVQADLSMANLEGANLSEALLMYCEMKECNLVNADLTRANFMWANLQGSNLTNSKILKTNFVEANLRNLKISNVDKSAAYLKYAKLEGTVWK